MTPTDAAQTAAFELPQVETGALATRMREGQSASLPEPMLVGHVLWFCRLRWIVVGILTVVGILGLVPGLLTPPGLRLRADWPFAIAGILTLTNLTFLWHARRLRQTATSHDVRVNLWCQIVLDLLILTAVVHFVGSVETSVPFAYLFHIVLACIFLSRPQSLVVVLIASALYAACVKAETEGLLVSSGIYADTSLRRDVEGAPAVVLVNVLSVVAIWLVVWYIASHLSAMVRDRDTRLAETNRRLLAVQQEKTRHMLRTTHELKAPFAAIDANTQLLQNGHCGELPERAREVIERIAARSQRLAAEIQEMLQLANLRSESDRVLPHIELDLADVLRWCIAQVHALAQERGVVVESDLASARVVSVDDHLKMVFGNVLSNAVLYSREGGRVRVQCRIDTEARPEVTISDEGIGILPDKLPRIFEEYYHTDEAVRYNKQSTGLGLAIVRQVAQTHGIRIRVESRVGFGTRFVLTFPLSD